MGFFIVSIALFVSTVYASCPSGWDSYGTHCYKFTTDIQDWVSARAMCRWNHADLIAIETQDEQNWFAARARTFNHTDVDQGFWLGGTDFSDEGHWTWLSRNFTAMNYKVWGTGQPNNRNGSEHCLAALKYFDYSWSDEFCNWDHLQYVCEKIDYAAQVIVG